MPKPGWSSITINDELQDRLESIANSSYITIPKLIEKLVDSTDPALIRRLVEWEKKRE